MELYLSVAALYRDREMLNTMCSSKWGMPILPGLVAGVSQTSMLKIFLKQKEDGSYNTA
jgi:hypothetical protein